jgi:hypothetical protein
LSALRKSVYYIIYNLFRLKRRVVVCRWVLSFHSGPHSKVFPSPASDLCRTDRVTQFSFLAPEWKRGSETGLGFLLPSVRSWWSREGHIAGNEGNWELPINYYSYTVIKIREIEGKWCWSWWPYYERPGKQRYLQFSNLQVYALTFIWLRRKSLEQEMLRLYCLVRIKELASARAFHWELWEKVATFVCVCDMFYRTSRTK